MITIEVEKDELVLGNGEKQLRVALPEHLREKAGRGTLTLGLIGNTQTGAVLVLTGGGPIEATGEYNLKQPPPNGNYVQCCSTVHVNEAKIPLDTLYNATVKVTADSSQLNTLTLMIGEPA